MRGKRGKDPYAADQPMEGDTRFNGVSRGEGSVRQCPIAVYTMDDIHFVPPSHEHIGQAVDKNSITAEGIRGIECRDHAEAERLHLRFP
jgi:hypothetical protein